MISNNQIALCNNLNMNFDEASELFCEESLNSMQTAKSNGGGWIAIAGLIITGIGILVSIYYEEKSSASSSSSTTPKPTPAKGGIWAILEDGTKITISADVAKQYQLDSITGRGVYFSPTPTKH